MKQFWKEDKWVRITKADGSYDFKRLKKEAFDQEYNIRILAGSTMPVNRGAMLDFMIRLAQTQMPDGQALVDREAVAEYLPAEVKSALIRRTEDTNLAVEQQIEQLTQGLQQTQEQFGQMIKELQQQDQATMSALDNITSAIEQLNQQILQQQEANAKIEAENQQRQRDSELQTKSYNSGFTDAESQLGIGEGAVNQGVMAENDPLANPIDETDGADMALPNDLLQGLEALSDDELALLMQTNPEIADLIR